MCIIHVLIEISFWSVFSVTHHITPSTKYFSTLLMNAKNKNIHDHVNSKNGIDADYYAHSFFMTLHQLLLLLLLFDSQITDPFSIFANSNLPKSDLFPPKRKILKILFILWIRCTMFDLVWFVLFISFLFFLFCFSFWFYSSYWCETQ